MPLSARSLHASGRISDKQMAKLAVLRGTRSQPSKMAPFEDKRKAEGSVHNRGIPEMGEREINHRSVQTKSRMTKGSKAGPERQIHPRKQLNAAETQHPKFPASGDVRASNPKTGNTRMKGGRTQRTGSVYDEPGRNGFR
jgi:hypothetical protein